MLESSDRNGDDGQKTDRKGSEPAISSYADIVCRGRGVINKLSRLKVRGARYPLTFKK
jgi:hypothetical protein